jgi:hypothetical protein
MLSNFSNLSVIYIFISPAGVLDDRSLALSLFLFLTLRDLVMWEMRYEKESVNFFLFSYLCNGDDNPPRQYFPIEKDSLLTFGIEMRETIDDLT